jgi:solute:Na+ symporter, SSS family
LRYLRHFGINRQYMDKPAYFVAAYFLLALLVGICSSFKVKNSSDFYIAGKRAGLIPVSGSLLSTILGGSAILGTIELSRTTGWPALWFLFSASLGLFILAPLSKYVSRYGRYTLPDLLGHFFGDKAQFIASIIIPAAWLGIIAAQIIAAGKILAGLEVANYHWSAAFCGAVFIIYTLAGGQISILKTDIVQSVLIVSGITVLAIFSLEINGSRSLSGLKINALFSESFSFFDLMVLVFTYSVTFVVGPDIYTRIFCAKNEKTALRSILIVASLLIPVSFVLVYTGTVSGNSGEKELLSFARGYLPDWFYGLFMAALLSAVMSSADTTLLTSSLILSELLYHDLEKKRSVMITRIIIIISGVLSIIIALFITSILQSLLLALTFFSGAFVLPMLAGLLKVKVVKKQVVAAMVAGGFVALAGKLINLFAWPLTGNIIIIISYFVNSVFLFADMKRA